MVKGLVKDGKAAIKKVGQLVHGYAFGRLGTGYADWVEDEASFHVLGDDDEIFDLVKRRFLGATLRTVADTRTSTADEGVARLLSKGLIEQVGKGEAPNTGSIFEGHLDMPFDDFSLNTVANNPDVQPFEVEALVAETLANLAVG